VATPFQWQQEHMHPGLSGKALAALGKVIDSFRTAGWVRGHDVVTIPGMGILDPALPLNPWGVPYAVYLLAAWGEALWRQGFPRPPSLNDASQPLHAHMRDAEQHVLI